MKNDDWLDIARAAGVVTETPVYDRLVAERDIERWRRRADEEITLAGRHLAVEVEAWLLRQRLQGGGQG